MTSISSALFKFFKGQQMVHSNCLPAHTAPLEPHADGLKVKSKPGSIK